MRRERADLAELDEGRGAHVAVNAAADRHVEIVFNQSFGRGADRCHRRGAGGVTNVVGTVKVENVGNAAGDAVGQFAGHAVFRNFRQAFSHPVVQFAGDLAATPLPAARRNWQFLPVHVRIQERARATR